MTYLWEEYIAYSKSNLPNAAYSICKNSSNITNHKTGDGKLLLIFTRRDDDGSGAID